MYDRVFYKDGKGHKMTRVWVHGLQFCHHLDFSSVIIWIYFILHASLGKILKGLMVDLHEL